MVRRMVVWNKMADGGSEGVGGKFQHLAFQDGRPDVARKKDGGVI